MTKFQSNSKLQTPNSKHPKCFDHWIIGHSLKIENWKLKIVAVLGVFISIGMVQAQVFQYRYLDRASWGADETVRFVTETQPDGTTKQVESWPREYRPIKKIVLHVTAGEVPVGTGNYPTLIGNVARYHARTLGWSDVGYNALVDPEGTIYEGRAGGPGIIGGHTHYSYKDPQTSVHVNYNLNSGTFGIALLGSYQTSLPSTVVLDSLAQFISRLMIEFGLDPQGTDTWRVPVTFKDPLPSPDQARSIIERTLVMFRSKGYAPTIDVTNPDKPEIVITGVPNIVFHRDIDWTEDPPEALHALLPDIRQRVAAAVTATLVSGTIPRALLVRQDAISFLVEPTETKTMTITWRNDGPFGWDFAAENGVRVVAASKLTPLVKLEASGRIPTSTPISVTLPDPSYIAPGREVTLTLPVTPSFEAQDTDRVYALAWGNAGTIPGSETRVHITTIMKDFAARAEGITASSTVPPASKQNITFSFRNIGRQPWPKNEVRLRLSDATGAPLSIRNPKWPSPSGDFTLKEPVSRGALALFVVPFVFPDELAKFSINITLERKDIATNQWQPLEGGLTTSDIETTSPYRADVSHDTLKLPRRKPGELILRFTNTGEATWEKGAEIHLTKSTGTPSSLRHWKWPSAVIAARLTSSVPPGSSAILTIPTRSYPTKFTGNLRISFVKKQKIVYLEGKTFLLLPLEIK